MLKHLLRLKKDAERYAKIKNKYSPFTVKDWGRPGDFVLTPDLDRVIDEWEPQEDEK
jgi:hypothetical protein